MKRMLFTSFIALSAFAYGGQGRISAEIQTMNGKAGEYVQNPSTKEKLSYLEWDIKNIPILKLGYDYRVNNWEFSVYGKKNIQSNVKSGNMKDYDWYYSGSIEQLNDEPFSTYNAAVTEKSSDPRERVFEVRNGKIYEIEGANRDLVGNDDEGREEGYYLAFIPSEEDYGTLSDFSKTKNYVKNIMGLDLSAKYFLKETDNFTFAPLIGFNYDRFEFYSTNNGFYHYDMKTRNETKFYESSNQKGITYKQEFFIPYIGLYTSYKINSKFELSLGLKGSFLGRAKATDRHLARGENSTKEKYKQIKYLSSDLSLTYNYSDALAFNLSIEATKYFKNSKSKVHQTYEDGSSENIKNLTGLKNKNISYSLGVQYKF